MSSTDYLGGYTGPTNPNPNFDKFEDLIVLYNYIPNLGFNVFAAIVWALTTIAHAYHLRTKHTRVVQGLIVFGGIWEIICYALRAVNHTLIYRADLFFAQFAINEVAPLLFLAVIHNALDNTLRERSVPYIGKPRILIWVLGGYNVIVAIITIIGAAMLGHGYAKVAINEPQGNTSWITIGYSVLQTGLGNQLALMTLTQAVITWILIHSFRTTYVSKAYISILFLTTGMIWTRTIYRLAEICTGGVFDQAWSSEALFCVFEFATVWVAVTIWAGYTIGRRLPISEETRGKRIESV